MNEDTGKLLRIVKSTLSRVPLLTLWCLPSRYDMIVTTVSQRRTHQRLVGTLLVGKQQTVLRNCNVLFTKEVFKITKPKNLSERTQEDEDLMSIDNPNKRMQKLIHENTTFDFLVSLLHCTDF